MPPCVGAALGRLTGGGDESSRSMMSGSCGGRFPVWPRERDGFSGDWGCMCSNPLMTLLCGGEPAPRGEEFGTSVFRVGLGKYFDLVVGFAILSRPVGPYVNVLAVTERLAVGGLEDCGGGMSMSRLSSTAGSGSGESHGIDIGSSGSASCFLGAGTSPPPTFAFRARFSASSSSTRVFRSFLLSTLHRQLRPKM